MKNALSILLLILCNQLYAQNNKLYLEFDFMQVTAEQQLNYLDVEKFWSKIHQERAKNGEILGWDLWSLMPGGQEQHFQFVTVTLYSDPVKMMSTTLDEYIAAAKKAYPQMSEADIMAKMTSTVKTREIGARCFLERIDLTKDNFEMKAGMVTTMDMMKVNEGNFSAYEKAEGSIFKPMHQKMVDAGAKGSWALARMLLPYGSDTYATHITFNFFKDWKHFVEQNSYNPGEMSADMQKKIGDALKLRDMNYTFVGKLEMTARP